MSVLDRPVRIAFIHPDLGVGGAERLVVDAALHLQSVGHQVAIFTAHHDPARCFAPTRDGSLDVHVHGDFLPMHIGQRLRAPCAILRMSYVACRLALQPRRFDVVFCDLVSHAIPLLRLTPGARVLFYCHFPDQQLAPRRGGLYRLYRGPIDALEALTTGMADRVLVNSEFTADIFRRTFPRLRRMQPEVVYPGVECSDATDPVRPAAGETLSILSISRFDRNKNLALALRALAQLRRQLPVEVGRRLRLTMAGGYDPRLREQEETVQGLRALARALDIEEHVVIRLSIDDAEKHALLTACDCVVYTPEAEHFGFVPVEAMAAGRPVVAVDGGGVRETVRHGETGYLCPPTPAAFADALARLLLDRERACRMGEAARLHARQRFSRAAFGVRLDAIIRELVIQRARGELRHVA